MIRLVALAAPIAFALCACSEGTPAAAAAPQESPAAAPVEASIPIYGYEVVARYPHEGQAFTQGLFIADGVLYESSGQVGESAIIRHATLGDATTAIQPLPDTVFGEGAVAVGDRIISLTWRDGVGHVHRLDDLTPLSSFPIRGEGWGLTFDGHRLIMSDGTDRLRFLDPESFEETGSLAVRAGTKSVPRLNELEYIDGEVWANIWQTDVIVRIDMTSGQVVGFVNLSGLHRDPIAPQNHVLNGIAHDPATGRLFVTGKRWPEIFEIRLTTP